jgi:hypothetical protein
MDDPIDLDFSSIEGITSSLQTFSFQVIEKKPGYELHDYEAPHVYAALDSYYDSQMNFERNQKTDVSSTINKLDQMYDKIMAPMKDKGIQPQIRNKNVFLGDPKENSGKPRSVSLNRRIPKKIKASEKKGEIGLIERQNLGDSLKKSEKGLLWGKKREEEYYYGEMKTEDECSRSFSAERYEYPKMREDWEFMQVYQGSPTPLNNGMNNGIGNYWHGPYSQQNYGWQGANHFWNGPGNNYQNYNGWGWNEGQRQNQGNLQNKLL